MPSTRKLCSLLVVVAALTAASPVAAQVIVDPRTAEFDPSPDHNNATLVARYDLEFYFQGASQPFQTANLGKPAPQGDGKIRVDLLTVLGAFPPAGTVYEARVSAVSQANGFGRSAVSNQFQFSATCNISISPVSTAVSANLSTGSIAVTAPAGCSWTASSGVSWITLTGQTSGTGNGTVGYSIAANSSTTPRSGSVSIGNQTFVVDQAGTCAFTITPTSATWTASAASGTVAVTTTPSCSWGVTNPASWIAITGTLPGLGSGTVNYAVADNPGTSARSATLTIAGRAFVVNQSGIVCTPTLSATQVTVGAGGGPGSVSVSVSTGCTWQTTNVPSWVTIQTGSSGNGNGTVNYTVAANPSTSQRSGSMTIAGVTYSITQEGVACTYSISPTSGSVPSGATTGTVSVAAPAGCTWSAVSGSGFVTVTGGANGSGNGTVSYSVAANQTITPRNGSIAIAGQTFAITQAGAPCTLTLSPTSASVSAQATSGTFGVSVPTGCAWTVTNNASSWITITDAGSGSGSDTIGYSVAANLSSTPRTGAIVIAGQAFTITQAGVPCTFQISPTGTSVGPSGTTGTITVTSPNGCAWTASSSAPTWATVTSGGSGNGPGVVNYSIAANQTISQRTATITIGGQAFAITQAGVPCSYGLNPTTDSVPASGGNKSVGVTAQTGCSWTATPSASWITVTSGGTGSGNGTINYTVAANPNTTGRSGTIAAGGQVLTITQPGAPCTFNISPGSVSVDEGGSTGTVSVTTQASCTWSATSNASWISVSGGGTGSGMVSYSIAANPGITSRTGNVAIAGQTFTVTQDGIPCTYQISPTGASVGAGATPGTVAVTAPTGCTWTAASGASWVTITGGANGSGNGSVSYNVVANATTSPRSATLTIAGHSFALTQAGGTCNFTVDPETDTVAASGGSRTIDVTVQSSCAWTATPSASWITITSGGSGPGSRTVTYQAAANTSTSSRSATIAIGSRVVTVTQPGITCSFTVAPTSVKVGSNSSSGTMTVSAPAACAWSATSNASWMTITSGSNGAGNGTIGYNVAPNPGTGKRTASVTVTGQATSQLFVLEQDGVPCSFTVTPTTDNVPSTGGSRSIGVAAQDGCMWSATPSASWLTITSGGSGDGDGTVNYSVAPNSTTTGRTGTIAIGGQIVTITQPGAPCTFSLSSGSVSVGANASTGTVGVSTQASCAWSATSNAPWITVTGGTTGNGPVNYSIAANPGGASRTGTVTIAGQTFTVTQAGVPCAFQISPTGSSIGAAATSGSVSVTTTSGCSWQTQSNVPWITATGSGSTSGNVSYSVAANQGTTPRTGTVTIAGQTFTINQAGVVCTFSVSPTVVALTSSASTFGVDVSAPDACNWTASSSVPWLILTSGSDSGDGRATFNVASNTTGAARSGTVAVAGQTVTVTQPSGSCTYTISPIIVTVSPDATTATVAVNTQTSCPWSASSPAGWVSFPNGATGAGSGSLTYAVQSNAAATQRSAILTIAGRSFSLTQQARICTYTFNPSSVTVTSGATSGSFTVTPSDACSWTPTSSASWLTISGSGVGPGVVTYNVQANTTGATRFATVRVGIAVFNVTQLAPCDYSISPTSVALGNGASNGSVSVSTGIGCPWTASSPVSWVTITGNSSGTGPGSVTYSVASNSSNQSRSATLNIAGDTFTVNQSACEYTLSPAAISMSQTGGNTFALVRAGNGCGWSATADSSWVSFPNGSSGSGQGWLTLRASANAGEARTGIVSVGNSSLLVNQNGTCQYNVSPGTVAVSGGGGQNTVQLTAGSSCSWFASSLASWITINQGSTTGMGGQTVTFTVAPNTGAAARTGTIRVAGVLVTISQSGSGVLTAPSGLRIIR